jgi:hypothetical protein
MWKRRKIGRKKFPAVMKNSEKEFSTSSAFSGVLQTWLPSLYPQTYKREVKKKNREKIIFIASEEIGKRTLQIYFFLCAML